MAVGVHRLDIAEESDDSLRLVLLHDNEGKVLVLLPAAHLLNLVVLWRETSRNLQPAREEDVVKFFSQEALQHPEGQRKLFSLQVFIDRAATSAPTFSVIEPHSGLTFNAKREWLSGNASVLNIGMSPQDILEMQPQGSDEVVISKAVERFTALRIKQRMEDTLGLPSLPPTAQKIAELRADPLAGVDRLVPIVRIDPSLAAQVMSWAVSPYYATPGEVQSIDDAVIRVLGFDLVVNLALGISMGKTLTIPEDAPRGHTPYWIQAVYTATLAERLCRVMKAEDAPKPGLAYLTGLIHNFGYAALAHLFPPHFSLLSRYLEANPHMSIEQTERHVLNVTREQVAAWLFDCWSLPKEVCMGVRHLNSPNHPESNMYAKLIYLTSRVLRREGLADGPIEPLDPQVLKDTGLTEIAIAKEKRAMLEKSEELLELVEMLEVQQKREAASEPQKA
ncbi:MAG: aminoacyl-tRNA deacylase and HDOD domain-containing protein [Pseudomonadales bacterium]